MRVQHEPVPVHQIFQQEQSVFARRVGDMDVAAAAFPQFEEIQSSLYKKRNKQFPPLYQKPSMN